MSLSLKKLLYYFIVFVLATVVFLFLQAKHTREFNAKYDPHVLKGMTAGEVRGRLGEPDFVTDSGAWVYNERGAEVVVRFVNDHVLHVKRNNEPPE